MGAFFAAHSHMVAEALEGVNFDWAGQGALLPHNVNRLAWTSFSQSHGVDLSRIRLDLLPDVGHCYICDPFLLLANELRRDPQLSGAPTLLSVGMGGYVGAANILPAPAKTLRPTPKPTHKSQHMEKAKCTQLLDC
jgi:3-oxoacyl-[acyl-carrier-protein] synthase-3